MLLVARSRERLEAAVRDVPSGRRAGRSARLRRDRPRRRASACSAAARDALGEPDVLVNNAGTARWRDLDDVPDEDWRAAWEVNVMASPARDARARPGHARARLGPRRERLEHRGKAPLGQHARVLGREGGAAVAVAAVGRPCAADGVLVNAICPGPTKSELWVGEGGLADQSAALSGLAGPEEAIAKSGAGRPIGRMAEVGEIAAAIVFLCSERASYVAGAAWSVDGGTVPSDHLAASAPRGAAAGSSTSTASGRRGRDSTIWSVVWWMPKRSSQQPLDLARARGHGRRRGATTTCARQRREAGRDRPHVQVVHLDDLAARAAIASRSRARRCRPAPPPAARRPAPSAAATSRAAISRGDQEAGDRVRRVPAGGEHDARRRPPPRSS